MIYRIPFYYNKSTKQAKLDASTEKILFKTQKAITYCKSLSVSVAVLFHNAFPATSSTIVFHSHSYITISFPFLEQTFSEYGASISIHMTKPLLNHFFHIRRSMISISSVNLSWCRWSKSRKDLWIVDNFPTSRHKLNKVINRLDKNLAWCWVDLKIKCFLEESSQCENQIRGWITWSEATLVGPDDGV